MPSTLALARSTHVRTSSETSGPTLLEELTDASVEEIKDEDDSARKRTLLGVPIPTFPTTIRGWSDTLRRGRERMPMYLPRRLWLRTFKSTILVTKVSTDHLAYASGCVAHLVVGVHAFSLVPGQRTPASCCKRRSCSCGHGHMVRRLPGDARVRCRTSRAALLTLCARVVLSGEPYAFLPNEDPVNISDHLSIWAYGCISIMTPEKPTPSPFKYYPTTNPHIQVDPITHCM